MKPSQDAGDDQSREHQPGRQAKRRQIRDEGDAEIGAERIERAAGEIDDLLHAEHELQAGGDQEQDGGVKHAADQDIGKSIIDRSITR